MQGNRNNTLYYATDPHLFFTFNDFYSREWNLFIENTNKGGGIKTVVSPDSSASFTTPDYADVTYYLGTTKKQKTFKHTLAADGLEENDLDTILSTLKVGEEGFLVYDANPYWGWDVVITKIGDITKYCAQNGLIVEFDIEFKTIGDWRAKGVYPASVSAETVTHDWLPQNALTNEYGIPEIVRGTSDSTSSEWWIMQVSNEPFIIATSGVANLRLVSVPIENEETEETEETVKTEILVYTTEENITYYSDLGIALSGDKFVEEIDADAAVIRKTFDSVTPSVGAPFVNGKLVYDNYDQTSYWYQCTVYEINKEDYWNRSNSTGYVPSTTYKIEFFQLKEGEVEEEGQVKVRVCSYSVGSHSVGQTDKNDPIATYYGKCYRLWAEPGDTANQTITVTKYKNL